MRLVNTSEIKIILFLIAAALMSFSFIVSANPISGIAAILWICSAALEIRSIKKRA
jgi:hypothetical protein